MFLDLLKKATSQHANLLPFVLYRKPGEEIITGIFQEDAQLHLAKDFTETGFILAHFDLAKPSILILADEIVKADYLAPYTKVDPDKSLPQKGDVKNKHINLVKKGLEHINEGIFTKVVLARRLEISCSEDPVKIFKELLSLYRHAFCYLWYHPKAGLWLGATPETLLHLDASNLTTISLAGTQKAKDQKPPHWSRKEVEEQALVTEYIKDVLKTKVRDLESTEAVAVKAGELWHLKSVISGTVEKTKLKDIINSLHPTPAVCGLPLIPAKAFITKHEKFDREFYTGFLGELNVSGSKSTHLFVNLRCLQLKEQKANIYVGGGITKDSIPEKEWQETVDKTATIAAALFNSEE